MSSVTEKKYFLNGKLREFECSLVHLENSFGILRYIVDKPYNISGLFLPVGIVTYGFYWTDRSYTLYRWYDQDKNIGNYFNIADRVKLRNTEFTWRDLILDVLIQPGKSPVILDEDELPENLPDNLNTYIRLSVESVLKKYPLILKETDKQLNRYV